VKTLIFFFEARRIIDSRSVQPNTLCSQPWEGIVTNDKGVWIPPPCMSGSAINVLCSRWGGGQLEGRRTGPLDGWPILRVHHPPTARSAGNWKLGEADRSCWTGTNQSSFWGGGDACPILPGPTGGSQHDLQPCMPPNGAFTSHSTFLDNDMQTREAGEAKSCQKRQVKPWGLNLGRIRRGSLKRI